MSDLTGKIAVITGANSGIGLEACVQLAKRGCDVVMCCRNVEKATAAREDVVKRASANPAKIHIVQLDLADLDNVGSFRSRYDVLPNLAGRPVDMLILNAGIMAPSTRELTKQGVEAQMGTNVVGHFKFAAEMIDLCKAAPSARVVAVSSSTHMMASTIDLKDFNREAKYSKWNTYCESKLGDLVFMAKLNRILEEKGVSNVIAVGCHPGYSATNLQADTVFSFFNFLAQSGAMGAEPTVLAATDPNSKPNDYAGPSYMFESRGPAKWGCRVNSLAWDTKLQDGLWNKCEEITKCNFADRL